jgi:serine phosphatase RsbU (regulator of sigma subunit)
MRPDITGWRLLLSSWRKTRTQARKKLGSGKVLAMRKISFGWLWRRQKNWIHLQYVPMRQLSVFLAAVFLLFSVIGFYNDLIAGGVMPLSVVLAVAAYSGLNSVLWVLVVSRTPIFFIVLMTVKEFLIPIGSHIGGWAQAIYPTPPMAPQAGINFAATAIMIVVIASYTLFSSYIGTAGRESFRLKNELALAHSIQKTLVPPVSRSTLSFEIYGVSHPSEKVGGDLVDVVELPGGDTVAYLADIAGHGLQAGILMGMLKTASRTALADGHDDAGDGAVLSQLMQTLNTVLPQVKEAHMFATFTSLRLNLDGQSFYGMAASPPLLHWSAARRSIVCIEEQQFPLGILPVTDFPSRRLTMERGDLVVIATDGILEVNAKERSKSGDEASAEFGTGALEKLVAEQAGLPLPELAASILQRVRSYGKQLDDQTLLLVRRRLT